MTVPMPVPMPIPCCCRSIFYGERRRQRGETNLLGRQGYVSQRHDGALLQKRVDVYWEAEDTW